MAVGVRKLILRRLMAVLAPLTGSRAEGTVLVRSTTGGSVTLDAGCHLVPAPESAAGNRQLDRSRPFFVLPNGSSEQWTVTPGGTSVSVRSVLGGARMNIAAETRFRWDPSLTGLELFAESELDMTGGVDSTGEAAVRRIVGFEQLDSAQKALNLFQARSRGEVPAVILTWTASGPAVRRPLDGRALLRDELWKAYVVVSRMDDSQGRDSDGLDVLDLVESYLLGRTAVDGQYFSDQPLSILGARRHSVSPSSYTYEIDFSTRNTLEAIDPRITDGTFADWETTKYDFTTADTPTLPTIEDARYPQP